MNVVCIRKKGNVGRLEIMDVQVDIMEVWEAIAREILGKGMMWRMIHACCTPCFRPAPHMNLKLNQKGKNTITCLVPNEP